MSSSLSSSSYCVKKEIDNDIDNNVIGNTQVFDETGDFHMNKDNNDFDDKKLIIDKSINHGKIITEDAYLSYYKDHANFKMPLGFRIGICGSIAAGKSTFINGIKEKYEQNIAICNEPYQKNPFLSLYYMNKSKWAFHAQIAFLASRHLTLSHFLVPPTEQKFVKTLLVDRVFDEDQVFAQVQHVFAYMSDDEYTTYNNLFNALQSTMPTFDFCIYLDVSIKKSLERIETRLLQDKTRNYEINITEDYLDTLLYAYDKFIKVKFPKKQPVYYISQETLEKNTSTQIFEFIITHYQHRKTCPTANTQSTIIYVY